MTRDEIIQVLQAAGAYDNRRAAAATVASWTEAAHRGRWTLDEALEAVHAHYAERTDWLMPGHITERIKATRQDAAMREPIEQPDPVGQARLAELTAEAFHAIDDEDHEQRRAALRHRCPHCGAVEGSECTRPSRSGPVATSGPHPSRLAAAVRWSGKRSSAL